MKKLSTFALLIFSQLALADFDCTYMQGGWQGEIYNYEKNYRDKFIDTYRDDGTFTSHYWSQTLDGSPVYQEESIQSGTWSCEGKHFSMTTTVMDERKYMPDEKIYEILDLTESTLKYQTIKGHSPGLVYDVYKVQ